MKKTLKDYLAYCENRGLSPRLVRAVINQHGDWEDWMANAPNIARHGIDGGFNGFIYYSETCEFARKNRSLIADYLDQLAADMGESPTKLVQGFSCLGSDFSEAEIGRCLYGRGDDTQIMNALAGFAAEECAHAYEDWDYESRN